MGRDWEPSRSQSMSTPMGSSIVYTIYRVNRAHTMGRDPFCPIDPIYGYLCNTGKKGMMMEENELIDVLTSCIIHSLYITHLSI